MHCRTFGLTIDECQDNLLYWLKTWSGRADWTVLYEAGYWHAACEDYEVDHKSVYEDCFGVWEDQISWRNGVQG